LTHQPHKSATASLPRHALARTQLSSCKHTHTRTHMHTHTRLFHTDLAVPSRTHFWQARTGTQQTGLNCTLDNAQWRARTCTYKGTLAHTHTTHTHTCTRILLPAELPSPVWVHHSGSVSARERNRRQQVKHGDKGDVALLLILCVRACMCAVCLCVIMCVQLCMLVPACLYVPMNVCMVYV